MQMTRFGSSIIPGLLTKSWYLTRCSVNFSATHAQKVKKDISLKLFFVFAENKMLHETTKSQPNRIHLMFNIRLFEAGVWTSKISLWVELHSTMQQKQKLSNQQKCLACLSRSLPLLIWLMSPLPHRDMVTSSESVVESDRYSVPLSALVLPSDWGDSWPKGGDGSGGWVERRSDDSASLKRQREEFKKRNTYSFLYSFPNLK